MGPQFNHLVFACDCSGVGLRKTLEDFGDITQVVGVVGLCGSGSELNLNLLVNLNC
jgi:hypothetical protein